MVVLPGAARPDQRDELAGLGRERDVAQRPADRAVASGCRHDLSPGASLARPSLHAASDAREAGASAVLAGSLPRRVPGEGSVAGGFGARRRGDRRPRGRAGRAPTSREPQRCTAESSDARTGRAVAERDVLEADLAAHPRRGRRASGCSSISTGRSSTSKTRSKLTSEVTNSTRAFVSAAIGP